MTCTRGSRLMAAGLLAALTFTGCAEGGADPTPGPTQGTAARSQSALPIPTPSRTPTPTPSTDSERAAVAAVVAYLGVVDRLASDPDSDLNQLNTVATDQALAQMQHNLMQYRIEGWRQSGEQVPKFVDSTPGGTAAEWSVTMCVDVSGVDVVNREGQSVKNPDSVPRLLTDFFVQQGLTRTWYVARDEVTETC